MTQTYKPKQLKRTGKGRRIAIGDIHGCFFALESLLKEQLVIKQEDQIFLLGDLINKGKNSALVLDFIIQLQNNEYQIFPIRGNHEEQFLMAYNCGFEFFERYLAESNSLDLLDDKLEAYLNFVSEFDYYIELEHVFLSHCGISSGSITPFTDIRGMFPNINFQLDMSILMQKIQVHGHLAKTKQEIVKSIKGHQKKFSIDSGCYSDEIGMGYLTALDLDNMTLFHQKRQTPQHQ